MPRYRTRLPQLERLTLTDGGLETDLIFHHGVDLPLFAAFPLLDDDRGRELLRDYYRQAARTAIEAGAAFSLDTATWRANPYWAARLGYAGEDFERITRAAIDLAVGVREELSDAEVPIAICGAIGPRGDGYVPTARQTAEEAREYHRPQLAIFADSDVDYAAALTLNYPEEAIGLALAAREVGIPLALSFTVETDGRLASGDTLAEVIARVDAASDGSVAYFGVNCAHPTHLPDDLTGDGQWTRRVRAYRANASRQSHAELDDADELDDGDPEQLGREIAELVERMPQLTVVGGCCGTDDRHLRAIGAALRGR